jgi:protease-4
METPPARKSPALRILGNFGLVFAACLLAILAVGGTALLFLGEEVLGGRSSAEAWTPALDCNVVGIAVRGPITVSAGGFAPEECLYGCEYITSSDEVLEYLNEARDNNDIKAILIDIESGGGEPVPSEEIAMAVKNTEKPSVAWIRQVGTSGAYWIASAADTIIASANSDVGSIGITMSYLDNVNKNYQEGLTYNSLSSGKYKDAGNPDRALTEEEVDLFRRDLAIIHTNFIAAVAANRAMPLEQVAALADGSTMLGAMALENGLIDAIGGQKEAYTVLEELIGEEPVVCWGGL